MLDRPHPSSAPSTPPPALATAYAAGDFPPWALTADVIALRVDLETQDLQALVVVRGQPPYEWQLAWPGGFVRWDTDASAAAAAERELREETGFWPARELIELRTYDQSGRDPRQFAGTVDPASGEWRPRGVRIVSKSFLSLHGPDGHQQMPRPGGDARAAHWESVYSLLPWEELRARKSVGLVEKILWELGRWAKEQGGVDLSHRLHRIERLFSLAAWNEEDAGERWDVLKEAGLVGEGWRDQWGRPTDGGTRTLFGTAMAFDHREMLADALGELRARVKRDPTLARALSPREFRVSDLQGVFEAIGGRRLYRSNFRRALYDQADLLEPSGRRLYEPRPGKPAELFSFRSEPPPKPSTPVNLPWLPLDESKEP